MKRMRLVAAVVVLVLALAGCSLFKHLQPPSWIIGTWSDSTKAITWVFTSDNVTTSTAFSTVDFGELYADGSVEETSTSTSYALTQTTSGLTATYTFEQVSATSINYSISSVPAGEILLTKQ